jgi:hypothetical protein
VVRLRAERVAEEELGRGEFGGLPLVREQDAEVDEGVGVGGVDLNRLAVTALGGDEVAICVGLEVAEVVEGDGAGRFEFDHALVCTNSTLIVRMAILKSMGE